MKNLFKLFILTAVLISSVGCKKYLDINSDPDTPQFPDASSVFPAMLSAIPRGTQYDARYISKYIQNLVLICQFNFEPNTYTKIYILATHFLKILNNSYLC